MRLTYVYDGAGEMEMLLLLFGLYRAFFVAAASLSLEGYLPHPAPMTMMTINFGMAKLVLILCCVPQSQVYHEIRYI